MSNRDYATDYPHLLHIMVDKVRWFTEEAIRQAHAVIDAHAAAVAVPTVEPEPESAPAPKVRKAPAKKPPSARG